MAFQGRILTPKNEKQREIPQRYMVSLPWHLPYIITMVIWYHMVSYGITWYHMVSHGITWYHMVSSCQKPVATSMFIGFPMGDRSGPRGQQSFEAARGDSGRFGSPVVTTRV